jgi:hypothetical protein
MFTKLFKNLLLEFSSSVTPDLHNRSGDSLDNQSSATRNDQSTSIVKVFNKLTKKDNQSSSSIIKRLKNLSIKDLTSSKDLDDHNIQVNESITDTREDEHYDEVGYSSIEALNKARMKNLSKQRQNSIDYSDDSKSIKLVQMMNDVKLRKTPIVSKTNQTNNTNNTNLKHNNQSRPIQPQNTSSIHQQRPKSISKEQAIPRQAPHKKSQFEDLINKLEDLNLNDNASNLNTKRTLIDQVPYIKQISDKKKEHLNAPKLVNEEEDDRQSVDTEPEIDKDILNSVNIANADLKKCYYCEVGKL